MGHASTQTPSLTVGARSERRGGVSPLWRWALWLWWIGMAVGSHWPRLDYHRDFHVPATMLGLGIDKWFHIGCYAGLAWLAHRSGWLRGKGRWPVLRAWVILVIYASIDEPTQYFFGRSVEWGDWLASNTGLVLGTLGWVAGDWLNGHDDSFVGHTRVVSALTLCSRMFGLVRDGVLARVFGLHGVYDAFTMANMIPNLFRRLFGEGALSAAFIPLYSKLSREDQAAGRRFAAVVVGLLMASLTVLALAIAAGLWGATRVLDLTDNTRLLLQLTVITILYMPLICSAGVLGGLLQVHHRFGPTAASPILQNLILIAAAAVGYYGIWGGAGLDRVAMLVSVAVVVSGVAQLAWALWAMHEVGVGPIAVAKMAADFRSALKLAEVRSSLVKLWQQAWPTALGLSVFQLNALLDQVIAYFFSGSPEKGAMLHLFGMSVHYPMREGSVAAMGRAQLLYEFPHGVFGIAVATAIFPMMAKLSHDRVRFSALLRQGLRLTMFVGLPASAGLILLREPLCRAIFFPGDQLSAAASGRIAWILLGFAVAVWAYSMNVLLVRAFYAQHNTITPMRLSLAMVSLNIVGNLTLIWWLGAAGLAWSTSICAMIQNAVLLRLVHRYVEKPIDAEVRRSWVRSAVLTAVMAGVLVPWVMMMPIERMTRAGVLGVLLGGTVIGAAVIFAGAKVLGMDELRWLVSRNPDLEPVTLAEEEAMDAAE